MKHISEFLPDKSKFTRPSLSWGAQFTCPVCECEFIHFESPDYKSGNDNYEAWDGRGSAIRIPMYCENDHTWNLRVGFHKGVTYIGCEILQTTTKITEVLPIKIK